MRLFKLSCLMLMAGFTCARAENIANPIALFSGLDKIMGVTTNFEAKIGAEVKYGNLIVKVVPTPV